MVSCTVAIAHVPVVTPALIVAVPVVVERSAAAAVSPVSNDAVQVTVAFCEAVADSVTKKKMFKPSFPSASATLSVGRVLAAATAPVGALESVFANPPLSVQLALTLSIAPRSASTTV